MNVKYFTLVTVFVLNFKICHGMNYDGYTLYSLVPTEREHLKFLRNLERQTYIDIKFWKRPSKLYYDAQCIVHPTAKEIFIERASHYKLKPEVVIENIQTAFYSQINQRRYLRLRPETFSWTQYYNLDDIYQWLSDIALKYSKIAELTSYGRSAEGRELYVMSIKRPGSQKICVVEGGIHGHEWLSPAFVAFMIDKLIHADDIGNSLLTTVAYAYHWYLIPLANPDGYAYTHSTDRLWRKNRRRSGSTHGVDLNRNFDYSFGKHDSSPEPADDRYCGPHPFSEPETKYLMDFLLTKKKEIKFYFSIHSYGQMIIIPYSDRVKHIENFNEMENYGKQAVMKIFRMNNVKYQVGTTFDTMGIRVSGNSASWVKKKLKVKYVYSLKLRDTGSYGYALPPEQILPSCNENLVGVLQLMTAKPKFVTVSFRSSGNTFANNNILLLLCLMLVVSKLCDY